ncbi:uncharacterized protein LOC130993922 [Salvia miltiorrhiza]|uniref:uncharacterized protein LOC130993922 n=1 Tax=Salvia miltiorrhiza TaxID=226208 RepID=UPI0025AC2F72|nr:uncharacterized protein LOC130993922 [Salvia miltiorrhiza]
MAEWFDDTSSSLFDGVAQEIVDEINKQKQLIAQIFPQPEPEHITHHRSYVYRDRVAAHLRLMQDYFNDNPTVALLRQESTMATTPKEARFKKMQESAQKDVERPFAVLQARCGIIRSPARSWYVEHLKDIMMCCIILHNMIVESEGQGATHWRDDDAGHGAFSNDSTEIARKTPSCFEEYVQRDAII